MKISQHPQITPSTQDLLHVILNQKGLSKYLSKHKSHDEIKIVYFGTPEFSAYILEKLIEFCQNSNSHPGGGLSDLQQNIPRPLGKMFSIQAVITNPEKKVGREQKVNQTAVALVADKYHIPVLKVEKLDEEFITSHLSLLTSDLFIVVSYGQILPKNLLDIPKLGTINIHGSILPQYRGASPIQQAILNGSEETGVTLMLMDDQLDHGPIFSTKKISISKQDTYETLSKKMVHLGAKLLIEILPKFVDGKLKPVPQDHSKATYCERLTRESGYFDINNPPNPKTLDRMIRAYYPWPGVWTKWSPTRHPEGVKRLKDLKIIKFLPGNRLQMEGKRPVSLKDFLNGYPDFPLKNIIYEILE